MRTVMKTDKSPRCTICQRVFTRSDHLKRHYLRHTGKKPYFCIFCNETFARCDNLRDHYPDCAKRGEQQIPENPRRGRRRHACQSCTLLKLRCDGESPCNSCYKKGINCNNKQTTNSRNSDIEKGSLAKQKPYNHPTDYTSIKSLLNGGADSFTEKFRQPPHDERPLGLLYHSQTALQDEECENIHQHAGSKEPDYALAFMDSGLPEFQLFPDTFFDGHFSVGHPFAENPWNSGITCHALLPELGPDLSLSWEDTMFKPEPSFVLTLIESISERSRTVLTDDKAREELFTDLTFLLTTARIRKFIALYLKYWHPSCAIVHAPTLDLEAISVPLLASMVFMGAMYTTDLKEAYVAKRMLDFVELYIFSNDIFSPDREIRAIFSGKICHEDEVDDWIKFQNFQAGLLITVVQYWAGSRVSRDRAIENRFSEVVKVARSIELVKSRHQPQEWASEYLWIQQECRIRTIGIISLLDCAFYFFQNYPCRLAPADLESELPCKESIFRAEHPFAEVDFRLSRDLTILKAFRGLFDDNAGNCPQRSCETPHLDLTILDMFILIHLLYVFISMHMSMLGAFVHRNHFGEKSQACGKNNPSTNLNSQDSVLDKICKALSSWRDQWMALRSQISHGEWASLGFYKNGYNFWLVSRLLVTQKDAVDVILRLEVNCKDKLQELNVLLLHEKD